ncbi:MAG: DUF4870 domain-containing protein [Planctomycetota bacterium]
MAETDQSSANPRIEPVEKPAGAYDSGNAGPKWVTGEIPRDARTWAMLCHLSGVAGLSPLLPVIGGVIAPLIVWQLKRDEFGFVDEQGRRAVNFQISMLLYAFIGIFLCLPVSVLMPFVIYAVVVVDLIFLVIAAVKANDGEHYRCPLTIRFFK